MNITKVFASIGIAVFICLLVSDLLALVYPNPLLNASTLLSSGTDYSSKLATYSLVTLISYSILAILLILLGFSMVSSRTVGSGLLLAGIFIFISGGMFSLFSGLSSMFSSILNTGSTTLSTISQIIKIVAEAVILAILVVMSHSRLDQEKD